MTMHRAKKCFVSGGLVGRNQRGQSYVETVVMLPALLAIFLGLYYFDDLMQTRMRAIEAARYVTWEGVWHVREDSTNRRMKDDNTLAQDLRNMGLGTGLVVLSAGADTQNRRSLGGYAGDVNGAPATTIPPQIIADLFGGDNSALTGALGQVNGLISTLGPLFDVVGDASFFTHDFFARQTDWVDEANGGVYTVKVAYRFKGAGFFQSLPGIQITEYSSLLTHPLNIKRTDNATELSELIGTGAMFSCSGSDLGHIFDLWLFPSGPFADNGFSNGLSTVMSGGKCFFSQISSVLGITDFLGTQLGFKMPDGTLKEFPELH